MITEPTSLQIEQASHASSEAELVDASKPTTQRKIENMPTEDQCDDEAHSPVSTDASTTAYPAPKVRLTQTLKTAFWGFLPLAPIYITANLVINTYPRPYFFREGFLGWLLFDAVVWGATMLGWGVVYAVFNLIGRGRVLRLFGGLAEDGGSAGVIGEEERAGGSEGGELG